MPLKLGRIEKKPSKTEPSSKADPPTTKMKAAPVQEPGVEDMLVVTNPVVDTVVVEHSPRDIVERTVTFEDDQVSVMERPEGRDTLETTTISNVAAVAAASEDQIPALPTVDPPPPGRPKVCSQVSTAFKF